MSAHAQLPLSAAVQRPVPVIALSAPSATSARPFGNIFGVRPLEGDKVLVNDAVRRQLIILDGHLTGRVVALDSASDGGNSYGRRASPFIPFVGDSTLFIDWHQHPFW